MITFQDADSKRKSIIYDCIVENNIATEDEIKLVTDINGYSEESMMDIIYTRTGLRSFEQMVSEDYEVPSELLDED